MSGPDELTNHRLNGLEKEVRNLAKEDKDLSNQVHEIASDMKVLTQILADLTSQLTNLVKQGNERDAKKVDEVREEISRERRMSQMELQLKIISIVSGTTFAAVIGAFIKARYGG